MISLILNFNDADRATQLALKNAGYDSIQKVVIVDNCSTDNSWNDLKSISNEKIDVIKSDYNGGFARGNNFGIRYILKKYNPDYIFLSNTDTIFDEFIIEKCKNTLFNNGKIGVISPRMKGPDGVEQRSNWSFARYKDFCKACFFIFRYFNKNKKNITYDKNYTIVDVIRGSFMFFRSDALIKCGLFDESSFLYGEEANICKRLKNVDFDACILSDEYYIHNHVEKGFVTRKKIIKQWRMQLSAMYYFQAKYCRINFLKKLFAKVCILYSVFEFAMILLLKLGGKK